MKQKYFKPKMDLIRKIGEEQEDDFKENGIVNNPS